LRARRSTLSLHRTIPSGLPLVNNPAMNTVKDAQFQNLGVGLH